MLILQKASYLVNRVAKKACNTTITPRDGDSVVAMPVIICGDFNDTPQSMSYKMVASDSKVRDQLVR